MTISQLFAAKKELFTKISSVIRYFLSTGSVLSKVEKHNEIVKALSFFKEEGLVFTRVFYIYILPYISRSFLISQKHEILINHYAYVKENFDLKELRQLFSEGLECYSQTSGSDKYAIVVRSITDHLEFEGSMYLIFKLNDKALFTFNFTFVPGRILGNETNQIIIVSAIQGAKGEQENIRRSARFFNDNSLPTILLKALESVALSFDIIECMGISAKNQLSLKDHAQYERFYTNYDAFWLNYGAEWNNGFYHFQFPLVHKPILEIPQGHRNRTLKKRKKLSEISQDVFNNMRIYLKKRPFDE